MRRAVRSAQANDAGKTTTHQNADHLPLATGGRVTVLGFDAVAKPRDVRVECQVAVPRFSGVV
jgi:ABC-type Na+ transport system ATPase subunit NatA